MSMLALGLWSLYVIITVVLRVLVQLKATRTTGLVLSRYRAGTRESYVAMLITLALLAAPASPALESMLPGRALWRVWSMPAQLGLGITLYALGLVGTFIAQLSMGDSWRVGIDPQERTSLVAHGLFRVVRNPIYTGMLLTIGGLCVLTLSWLSLLAYVALCVALELQVRLLEEPYLARVHGEQYAQYAARTGRFLPGIGRMRQSLP